MKHIWTSVLSIAVIMVIGFSLPVMDAAGQGGIQMKKSQFGKTPDGTAVEKYTLENSHGMKVGIITYGGIINTIEVPDKDGNIDDVALGFDSLDGYLGKHPYFGALVGRYANRIAKGKFSIDGKEYSLAVNDGPNALHGGLKGFDKLVWNADDVKVDGQPALKLTLTSPDGDEGYPGTLKATVIYSLNDDNEIKIEYFAETDKATPINLTNHSYFNLAGHKNNVNNNGHILMLNADSYTPVDATLIPTGKIVPVKGTPFDFTEPHAIGERINADNEQIKLGGGYDHNFVLNKEKDGLTFGGRVVEPITGRAMEFYTTQPGVQFYSGNFLDGSNIGKGGKVYQHRWGFCLETQHYPDSPNQPTFPSAILKPGEEYHHVTIYKFLPKY